LHQKYSREIIAIITLTYAYSYWLDWLVLRIVLNTTCNIMSAVYKGVGGREGWRGGYVHRWVNNASRCSRPSCVACAQWVRQMATAALVIP